MPPWPLRRPRGKRSAPEVCVARILDWVRLERLVEVALPKASLDVAPAEAGVRLRTGGGPHRQGTRSFSHNGFSSCALSLGSGCPTRLERCLLNASHDVREARCVEPLEDAPWRAVVAVAVVLWKQRTIFHASTARISGTILCGRLLSPSQQGSERTTEQAARSPARRRSCAGAFRSSH